MKIYWIRNPQQDWRAGSSQPILHKLASRYHWGDVSYSTNGKPLIEIGFCSISHSANLFVIVWDKHPIGLDIELERTIHPELISRLHLDPSAPMRDWCLREAWIKLDDDPQHLTQTLDSSLVTFDLQLEDGFVTTVVSHHSLQLESIEELKLDDI